MSRATGRPSRRKRLEAAADRRVGYRADRRPWRDAALAHRGSRAPRRDRARSGRQPIMAFWHGRILPATYYFRRRGIVVITSENFDGEWIAGIIERFGYGTARGSTSRGGTQGAAAAHARHGGRKAGRLHRGRPARAGARRAARRGVAREGDRQSRAAVSPRGRSPLDARAAGTARRFPSRLRPCRSRWANPSTCRAMPTMTGIESARRLLEASAARARTARRALCALITLTSVHLR